MTNLRLCGYSNIQADEGRYLGDQHSIVCMYQLH